MDPVCWVAAEFSIEPATVRRVMYCAADISARAHMSTPECMPTVYRSTSFRPALRAAQPLRLARLPNHSKLLRCPVHWCGPTIEPIA